MKASRDGTSGLRKHRILNERSSSDKTLDCLQKRCKAFVDSPLHLLLSLALFTLPPLQGGTDSDFLMLTRIPPLSGISEHQKCIK